MDYREANHALKGYLAGLLFFLLILPTGAFATAYSGIVAFGDSLSDNGATTDGHGYGRATNPGGSVWVEYLAADLNLSNNLDDYAYCGATSNGGAPNLLWQVQDYLGDHGGQIASDALVTLWIGGNDFLNMTNPSQAPMIIQNALINTLAALTSLEQAGAKNILVLNLPDLGATPRMNGDWDPDPNNANDGTKLSSLYNYDLSLALSGFQGSNSDVNLMSLDVFGIMRLVLADPGAYGFDNVTGMLSTAGTTDLTYLFWDSIHPTTQGHEMIADFAYRTVAPVPEPTTMLLLGSGLIGIAGFRKRLKR